MTSYTNTDVWSSEFAERLYKNHQIKPRFAMHNGEWVSFNPLTPMKTIMELGQKSGARIKPLATERDWDRLADELYNVNYAPDLIALLSICAHRSLEDILQNHNAMNALIRISPMIVHLRECLRGCSTPVTSILLDDRVLDTDVEGKFQTILSDFTIFLTWIARRVGNTDTYIRWSDKLAETLFAKIEKKFPRNADNAILNFGHRASAYYIELIHEYVAPRYKASTNSQVGALQVKQESVATSHNESQCVSDSQQERYFTRGPAAQIQTEDSNSSSVMYFNENMCCGITIDRCRK